MDPEKRKIIKDKILIGHLDNGELKNQCKHRPLTSPSQALKGVSFFTPHPSIASLTVSLLRAVGTIHESRCERKRPSTMASRVLFDLIQRDGVNDYHSDVAANRSEEMPPIDARHTLVYNPVFQNK